MRKSSNTGLESLPDEIISLVFQEIQHSRLKGHPCPVDRSHAKRRKLEPVFARLFCLNHRFNRLALPFLYSQLTFTEMHDSRLLASLQKPHLFCYDGEMATRGPRVKSASFYWELEHGEETESSVTRALLIEVSKLRSRIYQTFANLNYFTNLVHLCIVFRSERSEDNDMDIAGRALLPSIDEFGCLPFLHSLQRLEILDGRDYPRANEGMLGVSRRDCQLLGRFIQKLPALQALGLAGYSFDELEFTSTGEHDIWPNIRSILLTDFNSCSPLLQSGSFAYFCSKTAARLRDFTITTPYASLQLAPVISEHCFPLLETLCLREPSEMPDPTEDVAAEVDWSKFFLAICNPIHLTIEFANICSQASWDNFVSAFATSTSVWSRLQDVNLKVVAWEASIDAIAALDSMAAILTNGSSVFKRLEFTLLEPKIPPFEVFTAQMATANLPHPTFQHWLLHSCLTLVDIARASSTAFTIAIVHSHYSPGRFVFNSISLNLDVRQVRISADKKAISSAARDLLLTAPIRAALANLAADGLEVIWNI